MTLPAVSDLSSNLSDSAIWSSMRARMAANALWRWVFMVGILPRKPATRRKYVGHPVRLILQRRKEKRPDGRGGLTIMAWCDRRALGGTGKG